MRTGTPWIETAASIVLFVTCLLAGARLGRYALATALSGRVDRDRIAARIDELQSGRRG